MGAGRAAAKVDVTVFMVMMAMLMYVFMLLMIVRVGMFPLMHMGMAVDRAIVMPVRMFVGFCGVAVVVHTFCRVMVVMVVRPVVVRVTVGMVMRVRMVMVVMMRMHRPVGMHMGMHMLPAGRCSRFQFHLTCGTTTNCTHDVSPIVLRF